VAASSGRGGTKVAAVGLSVHIFVIKTESWVLLNVGKGQRRQAGSLKYPPRKVHLCTTLVLLLRANNIA
jgi:hypothetical protein